jgi:phage nucleotide-binding protein
MEFWCIPVPLATAMIFLSRSASRNFSISAIFFTSYVKLLSSGVELFTYYGYIAMAARTELPEGAWRVKMAINLKTTGGLTANGVKLLVYGQAGAGKTSLIKTLPNPIVLSAEGGLLSIQDADLPYLEVSTLEELREAYTWLAESGEAKQYQSVALDSISEIAEVVLSHEKKVNKDGRAAYGEMDVQMTEIIRAFRDMPGHHVYMSAKLEKQSDETGRMMYFPSLPGNKTAQKLPYFFDEVLALRVEKDAEGVTQRALMCDSDGLWLAKDRSGKLDDWEAPDLGAIIRKIGGAK